MEDQLLSLGVGGLLVVIVLREVFSFLKDRKPDGANDTAAERIEKTLKLAYEIKEMSSDLWEVHNVRDQDGVPVWYIRRGLEESIEKLAEAITVMSQNSGAQTIALEQIARENQATLEEIKALRTHGS